MITKQLTHPESIVVVGGSNDIHKPGGSILRNLKEGGFAGKLYVLNPKEDEVQGIKSYRSPEELPDVDLAIIAIAAKYTPDTVDYLVHHKSTRAFIILSAGYSEESLEGKKLEERIVKTVNEAGASLIGPNCIGVLTPQYHGVFTKPIPKLDKNGCDFISGSGATAAFIMEAGIPKGLTFANVYSVGNSAQMGVEDVLKYMDESFDPLSLNDDDLKIEKKISGQEQDSLKSNVSDVIQSGIQPAEEDVNNENFSKGFRVQLLATADEKMARSEKKKAVFKFDDNVYLIFEAPMYKIRVGDCITRKQAEILKKSAVRNGFKDAWIVPSRVIKH